MNNGDRLANNRKLNRWTLLNNLRAFDGENQSLLGHVADITTEGVKLVGDKLIGKRDFHIEMEVPLKIGGTGKAMFDAQCTWSRLHTITNRHQSGLQITKASPEAVFSIQNLINDVVSESLK